ncbi:SMR family transporter [Macrococcus equi]|uniref:SMR family transporter n=1 Tax=Macrococcus equi TaxID=3395462 RepID=UPI0039BE352B
MMYWLVLVIAGLCEMLGVVVINMYVTKKQKRYILLLIVTFAFSFFVCQNKLDNFSSSMKLINTSNGVL